MNKKKTGCIILSFLLAAGILFEISAIPLSANEFDSEVSMEESEALQEEKEAEVFQEDEEEEAFPEYEETEEGREEVSEELPEEISEEQFAEYSMISFQSASPGEISYPDSSSKLMLYVSNSNEKMTGYVLLGWEKEEFIYTAIHQPAKEEGYEGYSSYKLSLTLPKEIQATGWRVLDHNTQEVLTDRFEKTVSAGNENAITISLIEPDDSFYDTTFEFEIKAKTREKYLHAGWAFYRLNAAASMQADEYTVFTAASNTVYVEYSYYSASWPLITIHKSVDGEHAPFGEKTFLFKIKYECEDYPEKNGEMICPIVIPQGETTGTIEIKPSIFEYVSSAVFTVEEIPTYRYGLDEIIPITSNVYVENGKAVMETERGEAEEPNSRPEVRFEGSIRSYSKFSHNDFADNEFSGNEGE